MAADRLHDLSRRAEMDEADRVGDLVAALSSSNGLVRKRARESLVELGRPAVPALADALSAPDWRVRWEAAKALTGIADPSAAHALIAAMEDERPGVRWVAAEGVSVLGMDALAPLLRALLGKADSASFRLSAHHVLRTFEGTTLESYVQPVLRALDGVEPSLTVPPAAVEALERLRTGRPAPAGSQPTADSDRPDRAGEREETAP